MAMTMCFLRQFAVDAVMILSRLHLACFVQYYVYHECYMYYTVFTRHVHENLFCMSVSIHLFQYVLVCSFQFNV